MRIFGFEIYRPERVKPARATAGPTWDHLSGLGVRLQKVEVSILTHTGWTRVENGYDMWYAPAAYSMDSPIPQNEALTIQSLKTPVSGDSE